MQNIILNAFCLICSLVGTYFIDRWGRKPVALLSTALLTVFIFMIGALTKSERPYPLLGGCALTRTKSIRDRVAEHLGDIRHRRVHIPLPGLLQLRLDASALSLPARGVELPHPCERDGRVPVRFERNRVSRPPFRLPRPSLTARTAQSRLRLCDAHRGRQHRVEDVHGQRRVGRADAGCDLGVVGRDKGPNAGGDRRGVGRGQAWQCAGCGEGGGRRWKRYKSLQ
jgi:hypothetical protein